MKDMKVEKLLTLSQFVDYLISNGRDIETRYCSEFAIIEAYNNFLKQPLIKGMFINPLGEWNMAKNGLKNSDEYRAWKEAEKKVIFNSIRIDEDSRYNNRIYSGLHQIGCVDFRNTWVFAYKNLHDLAEATNGELTLKNLTI